MNFDRERDFEKNMAELVQLLKKILKGFPSQGRFSQHTPSFRDKDSGIHFNLTFLNFFSLSPDDLDELEDACEESFLQDEKKEDLPSEWSLDDIEFLKRHGIRF